MSGCRVGNSVSDSIRVGMFALIDFKFGFGLVLVLVLVLVLGSVLAWYAGFGKFRLLSLKYIIKVDFNIQIIILSLILIYICKNMQTVFKMRGVG